MPEQIYARYLKPGEVLFREGEAGDDAYIVEKGEIEISIDLPTGKKVIAELGKGEIIGEMSLIADAPRSATAIASVESELLVLKRDRLLKPIEAADPIMRLMIQMIVDRLRDAPRWMREGDTSSSEMSKARQKALTTCAIWPYGAFRSKARCAKPLKRRNWNYITSPSSTSSRVFWRVMRP